MLGHPSCAHCVCLFSFLRTSAVTTECFQGSLHSLHHRQCINNNEFQFWNYFLLLKNEQHFIFLNQRLEFLFSSSLHKPNMYKTRWILLKLFVQTGVTILSTCAKNSPLSTKSAIFKLVKKCLRTNCVQDAPHSGRSHTTTKTVEMHKEREIIEHAQTSIQHLATRVSISRSRERECVCTYMMCQERTLYMFYTCEVQTFDQERTHLRSALGFSLKFGLVILENPCIDHKIMRVA